MACRSAFRLAFTTSDSQGGGVPVPLVDLGRGFGPLHVQAVETFERLARSGAFVLGQELRAFEADFAAFCGVEHCVGVSDGTEALRLALLALGVGPGDEVVTVPHTFIGTVEAIAATGAVVRLADIDPVTKCMDPHQLASAIGPSSAAVLPVHLYGRVSDDLAATVQVARRAGLCVLEDAAQAHGSRLGGRRAGAWGDAGAFSFYPTKNLGALGDAGAVTCADPDTAETVRSLRHHGSASIDANRHVRRGATSRLDNLQAALLGLKLPWLDAWNEERRAVARRYRELLADLPLELPVAPTDADAHVYHLFVVEVDERDAVLAELRRRGVGAGVHYPTPVHLQPAWSDLGYGPGDFPAAEEAARRALSLPVFPGMREGEIERVAEVLSEVVS